MKNKEKYSIIEEVLAYTPEDKTLPGVLSECAKEAIKEMCNSRGFAPKAEVMARIYATWCCYVISKGKGDDVHGRIDALLEDAKMNNKPITVFLDDVLGVLVGSSYAIQFDIIENASWYDMLDRILDTKFPGPVKALNTVHTIMGEYDFRPKDDVFPLKIGAIWWFAHTALTPTGISKLRGELRKLKGAGVPIHVTILSTADAMAQTLKEKPGDLM